MKQCVVFLICGLAVCYALLNPCADKKDTKCDLNSQCGWNSDCQLRNPTDTNKTCSYGWQGEVACNGTCDVYSYGQCGNGMQCVGGHCTFALTIGGSKEDGCKCSQPYECASQTCTGGVCAAPVRRWGGACEQNADCSSQNCTNSVCVGKAQGQACTDLQGVPSCAKGLRCISGVCSTLIPQGGSCSGASGSDKTCALGTMCMQVDATPSYKCLLPNRGDVGAQCFTDSGAGEHCMPHLTCKDGTCQNIADRCDEVDAGGVTENCDCNWGRGVQCSAGKPTCVTSMDMNKYVARYMAVENCLNAIDLSMEDKWFKYKYSPLDTRVNAYDKCLTELGHFVCDGYDTSLLHLFDCENGDVPRAHNEKTMMCNTDSVPFITCGAFHPPPPNSAFGLTVSVASVLLLILAVLF